MYIYCINIEYPYKEGITMENIKFIELFVVISFGQKFRRQ